MLKDRDPVWESVANEFLAIGYQYSSWSPPWSDLATKKTAVGFKSQNTVETLVVKISAKTGPKQVISIMVCMEKSLTIMSMRYSTIAVLVSSYFVSDIYSRFFCEVLFFFMGGNTETSHLLVINNTPPPPNKHRCLFQNFRPFFWKLSLILDKPDFAKCL